MVDLTFTSRAKHFIPLALLRYISDLNSQVLLLKELAYLGDHGIKAIKGTLVVSDVYIRDLTPHQTPFIKVWIW